MTTSLNTARLGRVDPGQGYGKKYNYTADQQLIAGQDGALITNLGATSDIVITFPAAVAGMEFVVQGSAPYAMTFAALGTNNIGAGPAGGTYRLIARRTTVFACIVDGTWEVVFGGNSPSLFDITEFGASPDATGATNSAAIQAAHVAASEANPVGIVTGPCGDFPVATSVELLAHMVGPGGNGYSGSVGRLRFMPEMTDGSPCFYGLATTGLQLERFSIEPAISEPDPTPSTGNVQQCVGLQLGKGCSIITSATKANPCVITTKWYHFLEDDDRIVTENMVGMTELEGDDYYVTVVSPTSFKISTTPGGAFVDASGYGAAGTKGLVRPYDLGVATKCSRGVLRDITISSCAVNASIEGWMFDELAMKSLNGTVGFMGHYINASSVNLILENNWQGHQLLGCTGSFFGNLKDEGGLDYGSGQVDLGTPSTIDYCEHLHFGMYAGEGERQASGGAWLSIGLVSGCRDIHLPHGFLYEGGASGVSVALGNVNGYTLPERTIGGYSTTGSTLGYKGTASFSAGTTIAVTIPTQVDTNYQVLVTPQADPVGRIYVTSKTTSGFTITNTSSTSIAVDWQLVRN